MEKFVRLRICILTCFWEKNLSKCFLQHIDWLKNELTEFDISTVVVGSEGKESEELTSPFGVEYIEHKNRPLSEKWEAGIRHTRSMDPDAVIILGSDNFISTSTFRKLCRTVSEGHLFSGLMDMNIYDVNHQTIYHWNGYAPSNSSRKWETAGLARCLSKTTRQD